MAENTFRCRETWWGDMERKGKEREEKRREEKESKGEERKTKEGKKERAVPYLPDSE